MLVATARNAAFRGNAVRMGMNVNVAGIHGSTASRALSSGSAAASRSFASPWLAHIRAAAESSVMPRSQQRHQTRTLHNIVRSQAKAELKKHPKGQPNRRKSAVPVNEAPAASVKNAPKSVPKEEYNAGGFSMRLHSSVEGFLRSSEISGNPTRIKVDQFLNKPRTLTLPRWITPSPQTIYLSECFGHTSFFMVALSYYTEDFLRLRVMAIVGACCMMTFNIFHPNGRVLGLPLKWNALFIAINSYRIVRLYTDRWYAEGELDDQLCGIHERHLYAMELAEFGRLVHLSKTETYRKGETIVQQDEMNDKIRLVISGEISVYRDDHLTYQFHEGNFISEDGLHAGILLEGPVASCATAVADSDDVRVLVWDRTEFKHLLDTDKDLRRSLKAVMSWDVVNKLKSQRRLILDRPDLIGHDPEKWTRYRQSQTVARYSAILGNVLHMTPEEIRDRHDELAKYRNMHHITAEDHTKALADAGWTQQEYERGYQGPTEEHQRVKAKKNLSDQFYTFSRKAYFKLFN